MTGLHLIQTYSSDSDEEHDETRKDDHKIVNKYINYIIHSRLILSWENPFFY